MLLKEARFLRGLNTPVCNTRRRVQDCGRRIAPCGYPLYVLVGLAGYLDYW
jgi:hypothetical protein